MNNWDYVTRAVKINSVPGDIEVHEFDYKGINEVIYDDNGVVIRSIPAIHARFSVEESVQTSGTRDSE